MNVGREALEVLTVALALCPSALDILNKDKAWQCFIIDLILLCKNRYVNISVNITQDLLYPLTIVLWG